MPNEWNGDRKRSVSLLYKIGKRMISTNSQVAYLTKCLENKVIPKAFKIKQRLPGNIEFVKVKTDNLSNELVKEELKNAKSEHFEICRKFRDAKNNICEIFGRDEGEKIIFKHRKHYLKVMQIRNRKIEKKLIRDGYKSKKDEIVENKDSNLPSLYIETDFSKKKKRKFKRKFNQPQPKKERKIDKNGRLNCVAGEDRYFCKKLTLHFNV